MVLHIFMAFMASEGTQVVIHALSWHVTGRMILRINMQIDTLGIKLATPPDLI